MCLQMMRLMEHCISRVKVRLNLDTFAETALIADRVSHVGLHKACVEFALQEENRCAQHVCNSMISHGMVPHIAIEH